MTPSTVPALLICLLFAVVPEPLRAQATELATSRLCDEAAVMAARRHGIAPEMMLAITRVETGRDIGGALHPWPWTATSGADGRRLDSAAVAERHVAGVIASGRRNIDIGCFQLNHRWHAGGFTSLTEMLDPVANADYAARFLLRLHDELGDWDSAIAAYHSRTPEFAARYSARYREVLAELDLGPSDLRPPSSGPRPLDLASLSPLFGTPLVAQPLGAQSRATPLFGARR